MDFPQLGLPWPEDEPECGYPAAPVEREIERWTRDAEVWEGRSPASVDLAEGQARLFVRWLAERGIVNVRDIRREHVRAWLDGEHARGLKASTVATKAWAVGAFCAWLAGEGLIAPIGPIRTARFDPPPRRPPTPAQLELVLRACSDGTPQGYRDEALILTLYGSGCRVGEASRLNIDDLDWPQQSALIRRGKGNRERTIWLTERAIAALRLYVDRYRLPVAKPRDARALFTSRVGTRLSTEMMRRLCARRGELAGVELHLHPHLLRHAAATHMLDAGAELLNVSRALGHRQIATTTRYVHQSAQVIRATLDRYHPHARRAEPSDAPQP